MLFPHDFKFPLRPYFFLVFHYLYLEFVGFFSIKDESTDTIKQRGASKDIFNFPILPFLAIHCLLTRLQYIWIYLSRGTISQDTSDSPFADVAKLFFTCKNLYFVNDKVRAGCPMLGLTIHIDIITLWSGHNFSGFRNRIFLAVSLTLLRARGGGQPDPPLHFF